MRPKITVAPWWPSKTDWLVSSNRETGQVEEFIVGPHFIGTETLEAAVEAMKPSETRDGGE